MLVVGAVIGSGIFIVPATVLRQTGGAVGPALTVWALGGVLSLLGALTYAELGAARPEAGGMYVYIRDAFGPLPAFLCGWTIFFVISTGSVATLSVAFAAYLGQLVPVSPLAARLVALTMIAVLAALNVRGTRQSAQVQNWTTLIKAGGIVVMSVALLASSPDQAVVAAAAPQLSPLALLSAVGLAMIGVLWAYEGWQYVTFAAGEIQDAQRVFPRALVLGTVVLIALYLLANFAYLAALGPAGVAATDRVAATAVDAVFGAGAGKAIAAIILVSMFSAANALTLTAPRLYFAMARDGVFFARLAEVHPRFGTPAFAILAGSLWAAVLAATGTFEQLLTYVVFAGWIFYGLAAAAIFVFRRRPAGRTPPFRVPGYPVTPLLFVAAAAALVLNTMLTQPARAFVGLGVVLIGTPAFFVWRSRRQAVGRGADV